MADRHWLPNRPQTKRSLLLTLAAAVVVLAVAAFALVYFVLFPTSSPPKFALAATTSAVPAAPAKTGSSTLLAGDWTIAAGSEAGYRVREKLAFLPAQSQAVGRTSAITGAATFSGSNSRLKVTKAAFVIDVSTLKSDKSMRDEKIHTIGLESDRYPKASFTLSEPVPLPASALAGSVVSVPATGALTIHGITKTKTIPLSMRVSTSRIEVVGSITFPWDEFGMTAPSVGGFVNVTNSATMEFDLKLDRQA